MKFGPRLVAFAWEVMKSFGLGGGGLVGIFKAIKWGLEIYRPVPLPAEHSIS